MVSFADNDMQMRLPSCFGASYPLLEYVFCFFHELAVQVYGILRNTSWRIVLPEDEVGSLFVVLCHFSAMFFAFF